MEVDEFLSAMGDVPDMRDNLSKQALRAAAEDAHFWYSSLYVSQHRNKVIQRAKQCMELDASAPSAQPTVSTEQPTVSTERRETVEPCGSPAAVRTQRVTSVVLARKWASWCRAVREKLFGQEEPPFATVQEAADWVQRERFKMLPDMERRLEARRAAAQQISNLAQEAAIDVQFVIREMDYLTPIPGDEVKTTYVYPGSPLHLLEEETREASRRTTFAAQDLVSWVLTGQDPVNPPAFVTKYWLKVSDVDGTDLGYLPKITFTILNGNFSFEDLRQINRVVRGYFGKKNGGRQLTPEHEEVYSLVWDRDGPPAKRTKGAATFWEGIMREYNLRHGQRPYEVWRSVRKAYYDTEKLVSFTKSLRPPAGTEERILKMREGRTDA
ncbi:MAG: hypothetical protein WD024_01390 [Bacillota bacterium]